MFPLLLGLEKEEESLKSNWKAPGNTEQWDWSVLFFFNTKAWLGEGSFSASSAQPANFTLKEEEWLCGLQSDHTLKVHWSNHGQVLDLCERRVPCHSSEDVEPFAIIFNFFHVSAIFLFKEHWKQFQLKMKSLCADLKFSPELAICAAKNKHRFHVKRGTFHSLLMHTCTPTYERNTILL